MIVNVISDSGGYIIIRERRKWCNKKQTLVPDSYATCIAYKKAEKPRTSKERKTRADSNVKAVIVHVFHTKN